MGTIIVLAIYTFLILVFVPLDKIGNAQLKVKGWVKKVVDKVKD